MMPAWVRAIPPMIWAGVAVAVVVFVIGLGTYSSNSAIAESCTAYSYGRFSVVEDTPTCDAAIDDRDLGRNLMIFGGAAAIGLPLRAAATRRRPGPPPQAPWGGAR
jgi:hypothetical protein